MLSQSKLSKLLLIDSFFFANGLTHEIDVSTYISHDLERADLIEHNPGSVKLEVGTSS